MGGILLLLPYYFSARNIYMDSHTEITKSTYCLDIAKELFEFFYYGYVGNCGSFVSKLRRAFGKWKSTFQRRPNLLF